MAPVWPGLPGIPPAWRQGKGTLGPAVPGPGWSGLPAHGGSLALPAILHPHTPDPQPKRAVFASSGSFLASLHVTLRGVPAPENRVAKATGLWGFVSLRNACITGCVCPVCLSPGTVWLGSRPCPPCGLRAGASDFEACSSSGWGRLQCRISHVCSLRRNGHVHREEVRTGAVRSDWRRALEGCGDGYGLSASVGLSAVCPGFPGAGVRRLGQPASGFLGRRKLVARQWWTVTSYLSLR